MKHSHALAAGVLAAAPFAVGQYVPDRSGQGRAEQVGQADQLTLADQDRIERLSKLIGRTVKTRDGKQVGDIDNFVIDVRGNRVAYAILDVDPSLNLQSDLVATPYRTLDFQGLHYQGDPVVLMVDQSQFSNASIYDWASVDDQREETVVRTYKPAPIPERRRHTNYPGSTGNPHGGAAGDVERHGEYAGGYDEYYQQTYRSSASDRAAMHRSFVKATDLAGANVLSKSDDRVGEVEEILVHIPTGNIPFIAVSSVGVGQEMYAVPCQALTLRAVEARPVLAMNVDAQRLEQAPTINQANWPTRLDPAMNRQIYVFYSVEQPDWVYGYAGETERSTPPSKTGTETKAAPTPTPRPAPAPAQTPAREVMVDSVISTWPQSSQKAAREMIQKYGKPDSVTPVMVVWEDNEPWQVTMVHKDGAQHNFPMPHTDVLEQGIRYKVPVDMVDDLAKFDGSIIVDRTRGLLCARCHKEALNILALNLAHEIVTGKRQVEDAREFLAETAQQFAKGDSSEYTEGLMFDSSAKNVADPDKPGGP